MASIASLQSQVRALREKIPLKTDPRQWCLHLVGNEEIPAAISARFGPGDKVYIHQLLVDYMEEGPCLGWVLPLTGKGPTEILYRKDYEHENTHQPADFLPDLAPAAVPGDSRGH